MEQRGGQAAGVRECKPPPSPHGQDPCTGAVQLGAEVHILSDQGTRTDWDCLHPRARAVPCSFLSGHCHCQHAFSSPTIVPNRHGRGTRSSLPVSSLGQPVYDQNFLQQAVMCSSFKVSPSREGQWPQGFCPAALAATDTNSLAYVGGTGSCPQNSPRDPLFSFSNFHKVSPPSTRARCLL